MVRAAAPDPEAVVAARPSRSMFASMAVPQYRRVWTSGFLWNLTRWMSIFLCSYLVNQLTHSPFLVQLVGSAFFAPMFFGGALAGVISDRFDRRRTILGQLLCLTPIAVLMAVVIMSGLVETWMVYPFMLAIGVGMVIDMTSRRALVYDLVGEQHVTNALALEAMAMTGGSMFGSLFAGTVISALGIGEAFLLIAAFYATSFVLLLGVSLPTTKPPREAGRSLLGDLRAALRYVRGHRALISVFGVTIIMNLFFFSFLPMVPVFAERLGANAFWAGALASANAFGSLLGTFLIARGLSIGRGVAYVGGSFAALVFLLVFAAAAWYPLALIALVCAGVGVAGFATMQSVLVMISADEAMRGRAMGLLSMAIGALPFSMLVLGAVAQATGPSAAVIGSVLIGLVVLGAWAIWRPEAQRLS